MQRGASSGWPPAAEVVAATKTEIPVLRDGLVTREPLVRALVAQPHARLTLVSAPAGAGKTTLVAQWLTSAEERRTAAWLSLDADDNDPVRFWNGVITALERVRPDVGRRARPALQARGIPLTTVVLPTLINDLAQFDEGAVLALDDLHAVTDAELLRSLAFFIDRAPPTLHVAITSRSDPQLPLARLRARGDLVEIGAADLRFNDLDAVALLGGLGLDVVAGEIAELQLRLEGWAAGLQLAGLSLRARPATGDRVAVLRGDAAHIVDYLTEEVLEAQPPDVRDFLLHTSVLDRMTGELCDHLLESRGAADRLDALDAANLFVVALDPGREWFRYHHLFGDVLRRRLRREDPARERALHARAASWLAGHDLPADAIRHALAGDAARAADLVGAHWRTFFNRGELATVSGWLARLPRDVVDADPRLWLARAWIALDQGRLDEIAPLLAVADAQSTAGHRAWAPLLRAVHAFKTGDAGAAAALVDAARRTVARPDAFWRAVAAVIAGAAAYWRGGDARRELQDAVQTAAEDANRLGSVYALGYLSLAAGEQGDDDAAAARLAEADALLAEDPALGEHFVALTVQLARAAQATRAGRRREALAAAERALELARRGAGRLEVAETLRAVAEASERVGDAARDGIHEDRGAELREPLSDRELAVLRLLTSQLSQREIGAELFVSVNTVKSHCKAIFRKLRVSSREEAVVRARELGLL